jgi:hypothetical protein
LSFVVIREVTPWKKVNEEQEEGWTDMMLRDAANTLPVADSI